MRFNWNGWKSSVLEPPERSIIINVFGLLVDPGVADSFDSRSVIFEDLTPKRGISQRLPSDKISNSECDKSVQTFLAAPASLRRGGCAHVRRCPNWQCWRDSESGLRIRESKEGHRRKKTKRRKKDPRRKKIHTQTNQPRAERAGTMRSKGRARKLATGRSKYPLSFPFSICHLVHVGLNSRHCRHLKGNNLRC